MSAQGKLPRVGYSTKFDRFTSACQNLFLLIVIGCMTASFTTNIPSWLTQCKGDDDIGVTPIVREVEQWSCIVLLVFWILWNIQFSISAHRAQALLPLDALRSTLQIRIQPADRVSQKHPNLEGLAPKHEDLAMQENAAENRDCNLAMSLLEANSGRLKVLNEVKTQKD
eukprot:TRINITY_DN79867_c0_g1_i2.p1 TRINITY_DN79867_c0_g1~~TRINITY_DN79867_c0_g1_i2.p1  ORF type:complete len:191 (+),score=31.94 TRINITY_DN79867_c0_g1_i2:67-573(+)